MKEPEYVMLTRGEISVRGTRMGRYGGVLVHDREGVMDLPASGYGMRIWGYSQTGSPRWAELSDSDWNRLGWSIAAGGR